MTEYRKVRRYCNALWERRRDNFAGAETLSKLHKGASHRLSEKLIGLQHAVQKAAAPLDSPQPNIRNGENDDQGGVQRLGIAISVLKKNSISWHLPSVHQHPERIMNIISL